MKVPRKTIGGVGSLLVIAAIMGSAHVAVCIGGLTYEMTVELKVRLAERMRPHVVAAFRLDLEL